jgi:hypothetical protein
MATAATALLSRMSIVKDRAAENPFRDLRWISAGLGILTAFAAVLAWWYGYMLVGWKSQPQVLWAVAIWSAGTGLGFLFAIPRVLQGRPPAAPPGGTASGPSGAAAEAPASSILYEQRVNTNLEEISDWLTKIIIGMTLVQLNQIPSPLSRLSTLVIKDLPQPTGVVTESSHLGYGVAVIVSFFVLGFLFGYLVTRLYLQGALARAERGLSEEGRLELERRAVTAETSAELLGGVTAMRAAAENPAEPSAETQDTLRRLGNEYRSINIPDWELRTRAKNRVASALFQAVVSNGVSRDWLADQDDEALILALASTVHAMPQPEDAERLLTAAPKATRKHVRYRIASAFGRLIDRGLVTGDQRRRVRAALEGFLPDADPALADLVRAVMNQLGSA